MSKDKVLFLFFKGLNPVEIIKQTERQELLNGLGARGNYLFVQAVSAFVKCI